MKSISIILIITFCIVILIALVSRTKRHGKHTLYLGKKPKLIKKKKKTIAPIPKEKIMGPENPLWVKMYAEEMSKRNTAQTTAVIKKWLKEE
ncbi:MAG: hypothetical protein HOB32_08500 [Nitrospina sp.]|jgi:hypothetical protein|nr:hypothetical protein [Nitrospina sp.]MBT6601677.1 hypothetical protein [Nitrospina sp.]